MNNIISQYNRLYKNIKKRLELFNSIISELNDELEDSGSDIFISVEFTLLHRFEILNLTEDYVTLRIWKFDYDSEPYVDRNYILPLYLFEDGVTGEQIKEFFIEFQKKEDKEEEHKRLYEFLLEGQIYSNVLKEYNDWLLKKDITHSYINVGYFLDNTYYGDDK